VVKQPTLFDEQARRRTDATQGQKVVYEKKPNDNEEPSAQTAQQKALAALEEEGERETMRAQYARLLWTAATTGVIVISDVGEYVAVDALTDKEAAKKLGCEKTTINARRNELMGERPEYEACPVVIEDGSRKSLVRGTSLENTTYTINPSLIEAAG
jgi:hypothetical protein